MLATVPLPSRLQSSIGFDEILDLIMDKSGLTRQAAGNHAERLIDLVPDCVERTDDNPYGLCLGGTREKRFSVNSLTDNFSSFEKAVHEAHFMSSQAPIFYYLQEIKLALGINN